jgi:hypothetical protein
MSFEFLLEKSAKPERLVELSAQGWEIKAAAVVSGAPFPWVYLQRDAKV